MSLKPVKCYFYIFKISRKIHVINEAELTNFVDGKQPEDWEALALPNAFLENSTNWRLWALLSTGKYVGCDLIVEATGVEPNSAVWKTNCPELELGDDGGILVDERMRYAFINIYSTNFNAELLAQIFRMFLLQVMFAH
jgi:NADPH-dependent 2,4-dienoyl-CoA reductase/sulfur reductase-like enzyme